MGTLRHQLGWIRARTTLVCVWQPPVHVLFLGNVYKRLANPKPLLLLFSPVFPSLLPCLLVVLLGDAWRSLGLDTCNWSATKHATINVMSCHVVQYGGEGITSVDINAHGFFAVIMVSHVFSPVRATDV